MAKLHFRYGAMNCGKTTILIQTAYNYEERGQKVIVIKPIADTKGNDTIINRIGLSRKVDELIAPTDKIIDKIDKHLEGLNCILVDEVQFLTEEQARELFLISKVYDVAVISYGLRTDFKGNLFEASAILLGLADSLEEMATICRCGKKARFNGRKVNNKFVSDGDVVVIDNSQDNVEYESLCGECFTKKVLKKENNAVLKKGLI